MINLYNLDCLEAMKSMETKKYELAIVDPPYGIGKMLVQGGGKRKAKFDNDFQSVEWDNKPKREYFTQLFRVSKNQIIWGCNYFNLPPTRCNLIWDKIQIFNGSDFELAWCSFNKPSKAFRMSRVEAYAKGKIHPCEKPVSLYTWILKNYASKGDKILDTHLGSGSIAVACHDMGYSLDGYEIQSVYYKAACKRLKEHQRQLKLFR